MTPTPSPIFYLAMITFGSFLAYAVWQARRAKAAQRIDDDQERRNS